MTERARYALAWVVILVIALAIRTVPLGAAKPYFSYVDEGNYLHPALELVRKGGWDPRTYLYPQLPVMGAAAAMRAYDRVHRAFGGRSLRELLPPGVQIYDDFEPFEFLLAARLLCLALSMGIVVMTGILARRLGGPVAGVAALLLAALAPALVLRSSIATVDPWATVFVLAALVLTDVSQTSSRPGLASLGAGAMAGWAFASKYPAVMVILAFAATTLIAATGWKEKLRRLSLACAGLVVAAPIGMPALLTHPGEVIAAIRDQGIAYAGMASPPLWRQAFVRAEWDLSYARPEVGIAFVILAVGGLFVGLRSKRDGPTIWGWIVLAAASLALYGTRTFQPFRNLLPLVPIGCAAIALLYVRLREGRARPVLFDLGGVVWVLAAFAIPVAAYAHDRCRLVDPRVQAVDWVASRVRPDDVVILVRELGIVRQESRRIPATNYTVWSIRTAEAIASARPRIVVGGVLDRLDAGSADPLGLEAVKRSYTERFRAGGQPSPLDRSGWRGNDEVVYVLERED